VGVPDGQGVFLKDDATIRLVYQAESYGYISGNPSWCVLLCPRPPHLKRLLKAPVKVQPPGVSEHSHAQALFASKMVLTRALLFHRTTEASASQWKGDQSLLRGLGLS
jgi:hypothetical protein